MSNKIFGGKKKQAEPVAPTGPVVKQLTASKQMDADPRRQRIKQAISTMPTILSDKLGA